MKSCFKYAKDFFIKINLWRTASWRESHFKVNDDSSSVLVSVNVHRFFPDHFPA